MPRSTRARSCGRLVVQDGSAASPARHGPYGHPVSLVAGGDCTSFLVQKVLAPCFHSRRHMDTSSPSSSKVSGCLLDADGIAKLHLQSCALIILDFLQSKCLFSAERALRAELELVYQRGATDQKLIARNLWSSRLEKLLHAVLPRSETDALGDSENCDPLDKGVSRVEGHRQSPSAGTPTNWPRIDELRSGSGDSCRSTPSRRLGVKLHHLQPSATESDTLLLRRQRGRSAQQSCVVFREGVPMSDEQANAVERLDLPLLYNPHIRGLEDSPELALENGTLIAGRYRVVASIGKGSFSRVVQCFDEQDNRSVSVKVLHNDKDCIDQGMGEIRLLSLLAKRDPAAEVCEAP